MIHFAGRMGTLILKYAPQEWLAEAEAVEEVQIMEELPHSLRREIAWNINKKIFKQLDIFHDFPHTEQVAICGMMTPIQVPTLAPNPHTSCCLITW